MMTVSSRVAPATDHRLRQVGATLSDPLDTKERASSKRLWITTNLSAYGNHVLVEKYERVLAGESSVFWTTTFDTSW